jgi:hypothetical protein
MASLPGSPLASPITSPPPTFEIKLDFLSESLEQLLPEKVEEPIQELPPKKSRKRKSPSGHKAKKIRNVEEQDFEPSKKKKIKARKKHSITKVDLAEIFKLEEILKIKNISQDEDEYVDIL